MELKDLEYGMVVEVKNGQKYMYNYRNEFVSLSGYSALDANKHYTYDLIAKIYCHEEFDIMKVYKDYTCQDLLWERKEIELRAAEGTILANLDYDFKYIARDEDGDLYVYTNKPSKFYNCWNGHDGCDLSAFNHLFQFVKWEDEEPYYIPDLFKLKGEWYGI